ncbi:hypothetical protein Dsin_022653 [Dipteronia sinensis]|uniref:F-box domain-containing protein n=1 Tax=Dipteronia sinensis TaxID=43782 RepID=A0AAE0E007_9ROSI|nr:hypothetical protein Dsin_022653 [Dipteronia sinensis]
MAESSSTVSRKWGDMNLDILMKIFKNLPLSDLSKTVSFVCHSWRLACIQIVCWGRTKLLDLRFIRDALETTSENEKRDYKAIRLMKFLESIMQSNDGYGVSLQLWKSSIQIFFVPRDLQISDKHLLYMAERTAGIHKLVLYHGSMITRKGLKEVLKKWWRRVKYLYIQKVRSHCFIPFIEEIRKIYSPNDIFLKVWIDDLDLARKYDEKELKLLCVDYHELDLSFFKDFLGDHIVDHYQEGSLKIMRLLKCIMEGNNRHGTLFEDWRSSIPIIKIPKDIPVSDKHLHYIAERRSLASGNSSLFDI